MTVWLYGRTGHSTLGSEGDLVFREALVRRSVVVGRGNRVHDFLDVERYLNRCA